MDGQAIIDLAESLVDDDFGSNDTVFLNIAYHETLGERPWLFLVKWDGTQTKSAGSMTTITLPADYDSSMPDEQGHGHLFVGTTYEKFTEVSILDKLRYINTPGYFFVDRANNQIVFTGNSSVTGVVNIPYIYSPDDLTTTTEPVTGFKSQFQPLIGYRMAAIFPITEQEEKARSYREECLAEYRKLLNLMVLDNERSRELAKNR